MTRWIVTIELLAPDGTVRDKHAMCETEAEKPWQAEQHAFRLGLMPEDEYRVTVRRTGS